jgi:hypothetical protein
MNESRLDEDLKTLSKRLRPNLPTDFNATVLSKAIPVQRPPGFMIDPGTVLTLEEIERVQIGKKRQI